MQPLEPPDPDQPSPPNRRWLLLFLTAAIVLGILRWHAVTPTSPLVAPANRKPLPTTPLTLLDGTPWDIPSHRNQVILINYWATWCAPCQQETPALIRTFQDLSPRGLTILGISLDTGPDAPAKVRQFIDRFHVPYPIAFSTPLWSGPSNIPGVPTSSLGIPISLLIDRQGRIARIYAGPIHQPTLTHDIATLLTEP